VQAAVATVDEVQALSGRLDVLLAHAKTARLALSVKRSHYNKGKWTLQLKGRSHVLDNSSLVEAAEGLEDKVLAKQTMPSVTYDPKTIAELLLLVPEDLKGWFNFTADFRKLSGNVFHANFNEISSGWNTTVFKGASNDAAAALGECLGKAGLL
jgi:hypothetical protein